MRIRIRNSVRIRHDQTSWIQIRNYYEGPGLLILKCSSIDTIFDNIGLIFTNYEHYFEHFDSKKEKLHTKLQKKLLDPNGIRRHKNRTGTIL